MNLFDEVYGKEDVSLRIIWDKFPFRLFHPGVPLLGFKAVNFAIRTQDEAFFVDNIRNSYFPDLSDVDVLEAKRRAINRGIGSLNELCRRNFPDYFSQFEISTVEAPFNPLEMMTLAREKWIRARNGKHNSTRNPQLMLEAYVTVRNWGLGHFVLKIDESPEIIDSIRYQRVVDNWIRDYMGFRNPRQLNGEEVLWETKTGVRVCGSDKEPFCHRAKIFDENGRIRYSSILMKMFLKSGFLDKIHDSYGIGLVVDSEDDVKKLVDHFRARIKGTTTLEKFDQVRDTDPPFCCDKFLLRIPVRLSEPCYPGAGECDLRYVRVPVEIQIIKKQQIKHSEYKMHKYQRVFPLWYPEEIYGPILC
ncbi:hypothetical protein J4218_03660 [Candidatus Pacearchaeota archaeon]|nr:hypothetical protein [Candidatus Pacearchaeota archaeon]